MECPYCGATMEQGVIENPQEINWKSRRRLLARALFNEGTVVLSKHSFLYGSAVVAHLCRSCEKVIIDYKDGKSDFNKN